MEGIGEFVKKHPVAVIGGAGALFLIFLYASYSGSSSASSAATGQPDPNAELAAATQVQLAQLQAQGTSDQYSAALAATQDTNATNATIAGLNATTAQYTVANQANVQNTATAAGENVSLAGIQSQDVVAGYQKDLGEAQITAATNASIIQAATSSQLAAYNLKAQQSSNATLVDVTAINAASRNYNPNSSQLDVRSSESNLLSAISATGSTGAGLYSQVQGAVSSGSTWSRISQLVQNWAARTTNSKNAGAKQSILDALNNPVYSPASPSSGSFAANLLPV